MSAPGSFGSHRVLLNDHSRVFDGEDPSVCGIVYIAAESDGGSVWVGAKSAGGVPPGAAGSARFNSNIYPVDYPHDSSGAAKRARRCRLLALTAIAFLLLASAIAGVIVGEHRQCMHQLLLKLRL